MQRAGRVLPAIAYYGRCVSGLALIANTKYRSCMDNAIDIRKTTYHD